MTNKSFRDYINLIENAQRESVAEAGTGRPGTTPGFQDTLAADEKRREQRLQARKAQDKSTIQGIDKNRAKADAYRKSGVAEGSEKHECGHCHGTGRMVRDPDIGTDQECFVCDGTGYVNDE